MKAVVYYYWRVLRAALTHTLHDAHAIILLLIVAVGIIGYFFPEVQFGEDFEAPAWTAFIVSLIFVVRLVLAPYWIFAEQQAKILQANAAAQLASTQASGPNTVQNALSIEFSSDNLHEIVEVFPVGTIRRNLKLSIHNRGNGWISNCRLVVERTAPSIYDNAVELINGFTLQAGERRYVWFLSFDERFPDGHAAPKVMLAHPGAMIVQIGFSTTQPTIFTLRATSNEAKECTASFRAFVADGHLRLEKL